MAIQVLNDLESGEIIRGKINDNFIEVVETASTINVKITALEDTNEPITTSGTTPNFTVVTPDGLAFASMPEGYALTVKFGADGTNATVAPNGDSAVLVYENATKRANVKNGQIVRLTKIGANFLTIGAGGGDELVSLIGNTAGKLDYSATAPTGTTRMNYSGYFYATRVMGAYYADYAEAYNVIDNCEAGDLIAINILGGQGTYVKNTIKGNPDILGIVSDSYHQLIGLEEDSTNVPIALEGRVLAKVNGIARRGNFLIGSYITGVMEVVPIKEAEKGSIVAQVLEDKNYREIGKILVKVLRM